MRAKNCGKSIASTIVLLGSMALLTNASAEELDVLYAPPSRSIIYETLAKKFEEANPDIKIKLNAATDYEVLTQDLIRYSLAGNLPDVVHQGFGSLRTIIDRDIVVPLDPFIAQEMNWSEQGYTQSLVDTCVTEKQTFCLPFGVSLPVIFYNKTLVEKAGGNADAFPDTWPGIFDLAEKISAIDSTTSGIFFRVAGTGSTPFQTLLETAGGKLLSEDETSVAFDNDAGLTALKLINDMRDTGMLDLTANQAGQLFGAGRLGIFLIGSSNLTSLKKQAEGQFEVGVAAMPAIAGADSKLPIAGNSVMMLTKDTKRQAAAWKWMKFATSPEAQAQVSILTGYVPANALSSHLPEMKSYYVANPQAMTVAEMMTRATEQTEFPGANSNRIRDAIEHVTVDVARGAETPEAGLARMKDEVSALLPK